MTGRIPVVVLTGYLGAGKTTLLNRILSQDHGRRYAVIVNEFGEIGIDNDLIRSAKEEVFEMNNGCVCCTVRGDLIRTLHQLLSEHGPFDCVAIETSGMADPGPVVQSFFIDPFLQVRTYVDSVTTVVDAGHIDISLKEREAGEQIAFADQIILNKTELLDEEGLRRIETLLRKLNPLAPIHRARRADVTMDKILGRHGFDIRHILSIEPDFLDAAHDMPEHAHMQGHVRDECRAHDHAHDSGISSVSLFSHAPLDGTRLEAWLSKVVATDGRDILRSKGIFDVKGEERRLVFQSVHMILEGDYQRPWRADEHRCSRLVFIGRNLDKKALQAAMASCAAN